MMMMMKILKIKIFCMDITRACWDKLEIFCFDAVGWVTEGHHACENSKSLLGPRPNLEKSRKLVEFSKIAHNSSHVLWYVIS